MRDDGRHGLGHIGGIEVCEVHGEMEEQGRRAPQAVRHKWAEMETRTSNPDRNKKVMTLGWRDRGGMNGRDNGKRYVMGDSTKSLIDQRERSAGRCSGKQLGGGSWEEL